jgi:hypothetical protein
MRSDFFTRRHATHMDFNATSAAFYHLGIKLQVFINDVGGSTETLTVWPRHLLARLSVTVTHLTPMLTQEKPSNGCTDCQGYIQHRS